MEKFRLINGKVIDDLNEYVKSYIETYPDTLIYVGTDSKQRSDQTRYATCIGFLRPMKGVHLIYKRKSMKRINDVYSRLWNEVEFSRETGELVKEYLNGYGGKVTIHLDLNSNPKYKSHIVHDTALGFIKNLGFDAECKPNSWCSSVAADMLVRYNRKDSYIKSRKK